MSGVTAVLAALGGVAGGYSGTPATVTWGDINAFDGGSNAMQTLSGITGSMLVSATITGGGSLFYTLNGTTAFYSGAFLWPEGQTLSWGVNSAGGTVSGTVTVTNAIAGATLSTFTYTIKADPGSNRGGPDL
jgi:hypothetical protein